MYHNLIIIRAPPAGNKKQALSSHPTCQPPPTGVRVQLAALIPILIALMVHQSKLHNHSDKKVYEKYPVFYVETASVYKNVCTQFHQRQSQRPATSQQCPQHSSWVIIYIYIMHKSHLYCFPLLQTFFYPQPSWNHTPLLFLWSRRVCAAGDPGWGVTLSPRQSSTGIRPKKSVGLTGNVDGVSTSNGSLRNGVCVLWRQERGCRWGRGGCSAIHTWVSASAFLERREERRFCVHTWVWKV